MARPTRQGVDYFPLDIHLDDKFKFIEIKFGLKGFAVIIKLLQKIYLCGYWYTWQEDEVLIFAHENNIDKDVLSEIVNESLERDIFNKALYEQYGILTSSGIQKRYKEIVRRRKDVEVVEEYLLVDSNFGVNANIVPTQCEHDDVKSTQSKVKESKVKETKEDSAKKDIDIYFEEVWSLYPSKKGKGRISDSKKKELYKLGDEFKRCISRYVDEVEKERVQGFKDLKFQNGSTFFNSGYVDYLDDSYKELINDAGNRDKLQPNTSKAKEYTRFNAEEAGVTSF